MRRSDIVKTLRRSSTAYSRYASQSLSLGGVEEIHDVGAQGNGTHFWRRWKTLCALNSNIENGFAEHTTNISNRMPQSHQHIRSIHFVCKICGSDNLFKKLETGKKPVGIHLNIGKRDMASESTLSAEEIVEVLKNAKDSTELEPLIASIEKVPLDKIPEIADAAATAVVKHHMFGKSLVDVAMKALSTASPSEIIRLVTSLSELGVYSVPFKDAVSDQVLAHMKEFSGSQLATIVHSLARSGYYDSDLLESLADFVAQNNNNGIEFTAEDVAYIAYAYDKAGWCHEEISNLVQRTAEKILAATESQSLENNIEDSMPHILDALARVGCCEPTDTEFVENLIARAITKVESLQGRSLATAVVAATRLGVSDERLLIPFLDAITKKKDELSPKELVKTVKALGELGLRHDPFLDMLVEDVTPKRLSEFTEEGLSDLVDALNKLNYYSADFLELVENKS